MHIPEGYLSPQTCLVMGAAVVPFWRRALAAVEAGGQRTRLPWIAAGAAFAFAIQMLNVPVPDGTTAHATGAALVAVALGPWAALLALTVALAIQALVFGDGGLLALGANIFNMGVLESFTAWGIFRLLTRGEGGKRRRVWAAAAGAYAGINVAALATGVELGLQPLLHRAADGSPLYAPYPLHLAVPAMLYAHLLVAGPLEALVTGLVVRYLVRSGHPLLEASPAAGDVTVAQPAVSNDSPLLRRIGWGLGLVILLTPLGLLASGTAWGEWGTDELAARLGYVPAGLARWAGRWQGLLPDYTLPGLPASPGADVAAYWLSALVGVGTIVLLLYSAGWLALALRGRRALPWSRRG